jgi:uncharacterized membrane protein YidH (DUF202 family)
VLRGIIWRWVCIRVHTFIIYCVDDVHAPFTIFYLPHIRTTAQTNRSPPERTFLAWLRTSLSFASIGIAITQLFRLNTSLSSPNSSPHQKSQNTHLRHLGKPLGATFIAISIVMLGIGFHRYFEAQHYVIRGKFPASRGSIVLVSGIAGALIASSLAAILVVAERTLET